MPVLASISTAIKIPSQDVTEEGSCSLSPPAHVFAELEMGCGAYINPHMGTIVHIHVHLSQPIYMYMQKSILIISLCISHSLLFFYTCGVNKAVNQYSLCCMAS